MKDCGNHNYGCVDCNAKLKTKDGMGKDRLSHVPLIETDRWASFVLLLIAVGRFGRRLKEAFIIKIIRVLYTVFLGPCHV